MTKLRPANVDIHHQDHNLGLADLTPKCCQHLPEPGLCYQNLDSATRTWTLIPAQPKTCKLPALPGPETCELPALPRPET
ncbi:hypothetical protein AV530_012136 [Patagioenas fasciata monilis]|uniref:Uncharacterized protein n=1 Tax=Patagioenas fasciata monilis TaxID=372326 RepID=A0A1V4JV23_PATFA|nr:hypothetical protein AV530_012136 [Patagioenas fasciata monilis]